MDEDTEVISLNEVVAFLRRIWLYATIAAVVAGTLAYVLSTFLPKAYQSQTTLLASQTNPEFRQFGVGIATAAPLDISIYRAVALAPDLLEDARARALESGIEPVPGVGAIRDGTTITTEARGSSSLMTVTVRLEDPEAAAAVANGVAAAVIAWDQHRAREALDELVSSLETQIASLDQQIRELQVASGVTEDQIIGRINLRAEQQDQLYYARVVANSARGLVDVLQRASISRSPVAPRPTRNATVAALLAVIVVGLVALMRDLLDNRVKGIDGVTGVTGLPLLAAFPDLGNESRRAPIEAANFLRANLAFALTDAHPKIVAVTSAGPGEGKTTVAVGLASSFARQDYRVLLVDADLRKPMVATALGLSLSEARLDWAMEYTDEPIALAQVTVGEGQTVDVLPAVAGVAQPAERLAGGLGGLIARVAGDYDVIVFDSAPMLAVSDTLPLVAIASVTVLTVSVDRSNKRQVAQALDVLRRAGAKLAGVVATHAPNASRSDGYGYGYGVGYGYGETKPKSGRAAARAAKAPVRT
jgi:polysaccharide biosynthesis transport protein